MKKATHVIGVDAIVLSSIYGYSDIDSSSMN